ncbi:hypothetical protein I3F58_14775 [Streptomyces sp. MUM 203J]|uniref:hypothetical protein n=1 Tax=Streptomyces sp. MUM 203J TaxID=2791990 RepID=UPI001F042559|nr:hypothetical protein [Streptomyces sp. MUM 203J]MCH0540810.1 hypothetical protein [Streptomyces sp. MUM 203J]
MSHRYRAALTGAVALLTALTAGAAHAVAAGPAAEQKADGRIVVQGTTCTWTDAATSAGPPDTLTVDRSTVNRPGGNLSCDGSISATLDNDPVFTFDDAAGTARADAVAITGRQSFISCSYRAADVRWDRESGTRTYQNRGFTARKTSGSFFCPGSITMAAGEASVTFR